MTLDYRTIRKAARPPERTVGVCFRGDLIAECEQIERELEAAEASTTDSLDSGNGELLDRLDLVQAEMRENTYPVRLRGMPAPKYRAFVAQHPARRDDDGRILESDAPMGVNVETFWPALIRASIVDPELLTDADWDEFEAGITDYQYNELGNAAFAVNRGGVDVPFSRAASRMKRSSASE